MVSGQDLFTERDEIKNSIERSLLKLYDNGVDLAEKNTQIPHFTPSDDASA